MVKGSKGSGNPCMLDFELNVWDDPLIFLTLILQAKNQEF
jgi:hypothetical protein